MQSNANDAVMETGLASASLMIPFVEPCGVLENLQRTTGEIAFIQHPPQIANPYFIEQPAPQQHDAQRRPRGKDIGLLKAVFNKSEEEEEEATIEVADDDGE